MNKIEMIEQIKMEIEEQRKICYSQESTKQQQRVAYLNKMSKEESLKELLNYENK